MPRTDIIPAIVDALLRADKDGNDVITLSLGGPSGWIDSISSVVASRLVAKGRILTIAAGNEGATGAWYTSSPGNGLNVISIASVENSVFPSQTFLVHGAQHEPIPYLSGLPLEVNGTLPIWPTSNDTTIKADACTPLPANTPNLANKVVLVRRGTCNFVSRAAEREYV